MKIFQTTQKNFSYLGISSLYSTRQCPINGRNLSIFLLLCMCTLISWIYLCHVATTFQEYADSVYACSTISIGTAIFACLIWRMRRLFDCLNRMEGIINESKIFASNSRMERKLKQFSLIFQDLNVLHQKNCTRRLIRKLKNGLRS